MANWISGGVLTACVAGTLFAFACGGSESSKGVDDGQSGGDASAGERSRQSDGGAAATASNAGGKTARGGTAGTGEAAGGGTPTKPPILVGMAGNADNAAAGAASSGACSSDEDCDGDGDGDGVCDLQRGVCVECLLDSSCAKDERCREYACEPRVSCQVDSACPTSDPYCDLSSFQCEECTTQVQCGPGGECTNQHTCVTHPVCAHGAGCPTGLVCDALNRCVECAYSVDCGAGRKCLAGVCADGCAEDTQCSPPAGLCDLDFGACTRCLDDNGCPSTHHCAYGRCELDECEKGERFCYSGDVYVCAADGTTRTQQTPCPADSECGPTNTGLACIPRVCQPNTKKCEGNRSLTCSAQGTTWEKPVDCGALLCWQGACAEIECFPNTYECEGNSLYRCTADGFDLNLDQACTGGKVCSLAPPGCVTP